MRIPGVHIKRVFTWLQARLYVITDREKAGLIRIKTDHLTYLSTKDLFNLHQTVKSIEKAGIPGLFIETGCALGGSAIAIGKAKKQERSFHIYDAFGMIPPPSGHDDADVHARYQEIKEGRSAGIDGDPYYGYTDNLQAVVRANLSRHGVAPEANHIRLVAGYFEHTLAINQPVAFAHIDCDWYESVMVCLTRIAPHLVVGGRLIFDDYYEWSGCRQAVDTYFTGKESAYTFARVGRKLHVVKVSATTP